MKNGKVFLVGAGPGDTGLLTIKGKKAIEQADTIVYDRLANPRLLSWNKRGAKLIYVGKTPDHHTLKQEEINEVLVKEASEGKIVTRLKGGDPYVFGRGGEEGERLREAGIPFEVIPGITSAISAPAYAGIPVTHRTLTSTFKIITGHEDPEKETSQVDWDVLAQDPGTLIFLMGVGNLPKITKELIKRGKPSTTPVALIQWGTRPEQRVATGTLETIVDEVKKAGITSPAIIIMGDVVKMRDTLRWFEDQPLFGKRILVTRAREQASELSEKIEELGGEAWEFPTISIQSNFDDSAFKNAVHEAKDYDWIIFTSVNGVKSFFELMRREKIDIRALGNAKICAIGPKTAKEIEDKGLLVNAMPEKFQNEYVIEALKPLVKQGDKVLIPRSDLGREILVNALKDLGTDVTEVIAYKTVMADDVDKEILREYLENNQIQLITVTSSSTVRNLVNLLDRDLTLLKDIPIASIGPITSNTAKELGLDVTIEAEEYTIDGLMEAIQNYFK